MSSMDPFDEFEFKPLTDGLGFHKKALNLKDGLKSSGVLNEELKSVPMSMPRGMADEEVKVSPRHTFEEVLSALEKTPLNRPARPDLNFTEPLPRERQKKQAMEMELPLPVQSPFPRPEAYKTPEFKKIAPTLEKPSVGVRRGAADSPKRKLIPMAVSFASAFLDSIIVLALSLVFLIAVLMVTKVDMGVVLNNLDKDLMTQLSLLVLFVSVMQMYVIISRSFFGRTIGEWTFELQLGRDEEQAKESYPVRIALRCLLNTATGLVILPLISALLGRDVAGQLTGVQLYRQRT